MTGQLEIVDLHPALGLVLRAGPLELRGISDDLLPALADLAAAGIHDPASMPFSVPWTDVEPAGFASSFAAYHWRCRAEWSVAEWHLNLAVFQEGDLVGAQGLAAKHYLVTRSAETGSWLGRAHQGRGIGTAMRQAMCVFAFDHLDAAEVTSGAFVDNPASRAVSRKVGYRPNGVSRWQRREGELAEHESLRLGPDDLVRGQHPLEVEGLAAFRRSIGLDS
jgi:RimJ/RimL family protein N-acetyltransferase